MTPFEAATHADPYAYYARLRQQGGLYFDTGLHLWIASGAHVVEAILDHPDCRVRPLHEPVPAPIASGAAGQIFAQMMRMNEGPSHLGPRMAIAPALASVEAQRLAEIVTRLAATLDNPAKKLDELMFTLPVYVIATLLGFNPDQCRDVVRRTRDFVACLSPLSNGPELAKAHAGAVRLSAGFNTLLSNDVNASSVLSHILRDCKATTWADPDALVANLIGLLSQTCEASAGLIGNTLIALHRSPELLETVQTAPATLARLVAETARYDPPVQNTRRFVARPCVIANRTLATGDTLVVLLASANRDPIANPAPDSFLLDRAHPQTFSFGSGRHQCPGQQLALAIASEAIRLWLQHPPPSPARQLRWHYLPSLNGRIPQFEGAL